MPSAQTKYWLSEKPLLLPALGPVARSFAHLAAGFICPGQGREGLADVFRTGSVHNVCNAALGAHPALVQDNDAIRLCDFIDQMRGPKDTSRPRCGERSHMPHDVLARRYIQARP